MCSAEMHASIRCCRCRLADVLARRDSAAGGSFWCASGHAAASTA